MQLSTSSCWQHVCSSWETTMQRKHQQQALLAQQHSRVSAYPTHPSHAQQHLLCISIMINNFPGSLLDHEHNGMYYWVSLQDMC
jgi:hypothetical protein